VIDLIEVTCLADGDIAVDEMREENDCMGTSSTGNHNRVNARFGSGYWVRTNLVNFGMMLKHRERLLLLMKGGYTE
jgi:hypothetical protein